MKIFLDPGHNYSGSDTGAAGNGLKEQEITFYIAEKTKLKLEEAGLDVKMSRENLTDNVGYGSTSSSLYQRAKMANDWGADLFISIHCNAGGGTGTETYSYQAGITNGHKLAEDVQKRIIALTGLRDRGVKTANFAVLKNTEMPAILVETAFIDNTGSDALLLGSESGQDLFAEGITQGVLDYLLIDYEKEDLTMTQYEELKKEISELREENNMLKEKVNILSSPMIWNYIDENLPEWARPTIQKLVSKGFLKGNENGELGLTEDLIRGFVVNDNAKLYGE